jgi:hypothetical protein
MDVLQQAQQLLRDYKAGFKTADRIQMDMIATAKEKNLSYGQSILGPGFKKELGVQGITARQTPAQFLGAYTSRALIDVANDGTRSYYWRFNHPLAIADKLVGLGVNKDMLASPTARAAIGLGVAVPAIAATGLYDITNLDEQGRPKGFAQSYAPKGAEDRRTTGQPVQEIFERFVLQRSGDPLKYATAKAEIPDLTPQRYANYMNFMYQDKGLFGLGIVKGTMENLQGTPEIRMLGFPVNAPMVGGFAGGTVAANLATRAPGTPRQKAVRGLIGGLAGSLGGVGVGNVVNQVIKNNINNQQLAATQLNSQLPMQ